MREKLNPNWFVLPAEQIQLRHTLNAEQIAWFKAGSALNQLAAGGKA